MRKFRQLFLQKGFLITMCGFLGCDDLISASKCASSWWQNAAKDKSRIAYLSAGNFASCCCFNDEIHRIMKWWYTGWHFRIFQQNNGKQYTIYHQIRHQMTTDIYHRDSTDMPPTVHRNRNGRGVSRAVSSGEITAKSRPRCRSSIGRDIGRVSADSVGWYSTDTRVSADRCRQISVEYRPIVARVLAECRPIVAQVSADSRRIVARVSADSSPSVGP